MGVDMPSWDRDACLNKTTTLLCGFILECMECHSYSIAIMKCCTTIEFTDLFGSSKQLDVIHWRVLGCSDAM